MGKHFWYDKRCPKCWTTNQVKSNWDYTRCDNDDCKKKIHLNPKT